MERIDLKFLFGLSVSWEGGPDEKMRVIRFCMDMGVIASEYECPKCGRQMKLTANKKAADYFEWACRSKVVPIHRIRRSVRLGSWFARSNLSLTDILLMTEFFVRERSQNDIIYELKLSNKCVCEWRCFFREVCFQIMLNESEMIGGEGKIVEINKSKFEKRKFLRDKHVDGTLVFRGVERESKKCFLKVVEKLDKEMLISLIKEYILPGTTIISTCWESFDTLKDEGFVHLTVNFDFV